MEQVSTPPTRLIFFNPNVAFSLIPIQSVFLWQLESQYLYHTQMALVIFSVLPACKHSSAGTIWLKWRSGFLFPAVDDSLSLSIMNFCYGQVVWSINRIRNAEVMAPAHHFGIPSHIKASPILWLHRSWWIPRLFNNTGFDNIAFGKGREIPLR